jgi:hypothetical protein
MPLSWRWKTTKEKGEPRGTVEFWAGPDRARRKRRGGLRKRWTRDGGRPKRKGEVLCNIL